MYEEGCGPNDIITDDPHADETQPSKSGAQARASSTKAKSKMKQSNVLDHFDRVVDEITKKIKA